MASEQVPPPIPTAAPLLARWGSSGKLLAIGGAVGVVAVFLPLISRSAPNLGGAFGFPAMPAGVNMPTQHVMVIDIWQGKIGLAIYVAALVLAFVLYPPTGLAQKSIAWAGAGVGAVALLLSLWLFILVMRSSSDAVAGMIGINSSVGFGAFVNVLAAGAVAAGGLLKAREEKLILAGAAKRVVQPVGRPERPEYIGEVPFRGGSQMAHDIRVIHARDFLRANVEGRFDLEASKALLRDLAKAVVGCQDRHILLDIRGTNRPTMTSSDLYELVQTLKELGLGVFNRIAIIRRLTDTFDRSRFFEMLATDRGMQVGTFDDFESAFEWLQTGGPTPLSQVK